MKTRLATPIYNAARMLLERGIEPVEIDNCLNGAEQPSKGYVYLDDLPLPAKSNKKS